MIKTECYRLLDGTLIEGRLNACRAAEEKRGAAITALARELAAAGSGGKPYSKLVEYLDTPEALRAMKNIIALTDDLKIHGDES